MDAEALAREALRLLDEGDLDQFEQTMEPDCELVGPGFEVRGRVAAREFVQGFRQAFPDVKHTIESVYADGDTIIVEYTFAGTHSGPLRTPRGEIPPTGKQIRIRAAQVVEMRNGKARALRTYYDRLEMMTQLGLIPG